MRAINRVKNISIKKTIKEILDNKVEPYCFGEFIKNKKGILSERVNFERIRTTNTCSSYERYSDNPLKHISVSCRMGESISKTMNAEKIKRELAEKEKAMRMSNLLLSCELGNLISRNINIEDINRKRELEIKREITEKEKAVIMSNLNKFCIDESDDFINDGNSLSRVINECNNIKKKRL